MSDVNGLTRLRDRGLRITVVGAGHVGLVSASCLATLGHRVRVLDIDRRRIDLLQEGQMPFVEPFLDDLLFRAIARKEISFHTSAEEAATGADVSFICVGTPNLPDGSVDMRGLIEATASVAPHVPTSSTVVSRSTAPVGTGTYLRSLVREVRGDGCPPVVVNPEFLSEGTAMRDFLRPDRIVVGCWEERAAKAVALAYRPIIDRELPTWLSRALGVDEPSGAPYEPVPLIVTDPATAELTKYAANAFLAVRISFMNEMATIAEELGADVTLISRAMGLDPRIGRHFLSAGVGWGGSCFPKDIVALQGIAQTRGVQARMLQAANDINADQRHWVRRQLQRHLRTLVGRRVGLLGLAFKPNTDDVRHSPALEIAADLEAAGVRIRAYDPAVSHLPAAIAGSIEIAPDPIAAAAGAEALVVVTDWPEFSSIPLGSLRKAVRIPLLLDGRNALDREEAERAGFTYVGVGRPLSPVVALEEPVAVEA